METKKVGPVVISIKGKTLSLFFIGINFCERAVALNAAKSAVKEKFGDKAAVIYPNIDSFLAAIYSSNDGIGTFSIEEGIKGYTIIPRQKGPSSEPIRPNIQRIDAAT